MCVEIEYVVDGAPLVGRRRLKPAPFECDLPALGGVWNAWIPPEFQTCDRDAFFGDERDAASRSFLAFLFDARNRAVDQTAARFLNRFGDADALRRALADAVELPAPSENAEIATPTWGAVFGNPALVAQLFAPDAKTTDEAASNAPSASAAPSPFGPLGAAREPFRLYVDRFALAQVRVTPTTPLAFAAATASDATERARRVALQTLESARVVLLFVDDALAVLTSDDVLADFAPQALETTGDAISVLKIKNSGAARRFRASLLAETSPRFVLSTAWPQARDAEPVWRVRSGEESAAGWIRTTTPLDRATANGVWIVERYWLAALEWFCLVGFVAATWGRRFATPTFFVAVLGVSIAVQCAAPLEIALAARGFTIGTLCAFGFYNVRLWAPRSGAERRDADGDVSRFSRISRRPADSDRSQISGDASELDVVVRDGSFATRPDGRERRREKATRPEESTQGFVDLSKLPEATRRRLEGPADAPVDAPRRDAEIDDASTETRPENRPVPPSPRRQGSTSMQTTTALAALSFALLLGASTLVDAASPRVDGDVPSASETLPVVPEESNAVASPDRASTAPTAAPTWREPRRVFVPIDAERRPVGPYYWVPSDFYEEIRSTLAARPSERSWRVVDALYEGVVNHNAFADATSLFNLTATYSVVLDEPNATIAFPATRLAPDFDVKFDDRAIAPTFAENGREIFFEIVDAEPGEHRLELTIAPPQFSETNAEISFPIPPVPSARLELTVPPDAPTFDFPNALGKTTRSPGRVVVELGAIDRLVVAKTASNVPSGKTSVDVEQLFLMRARPTQADVRASFRCQVVGGKVSSLVLVGDPLYSFSGYCQCDKTEIESVETLADGSSRVAFKTPISGAFALDADFVARNFSGVGRARLPSLAVRDARVLKSWLALVPGGDVECANIPPATETIAAFQHAWGAPLK